jgi:hypothetical protein
MQNGVFRLQQELMCTGLQVQNPHKSHDDTEVTLFRSIAARHANGNRNQCRQV